MAEAAWQSLPLMRDGAPAILENKDAFFKVMSKFVENECQDVGVDSISFLFSQLTQIVNLLKHMGLENLIGVYNAILTHAHFSFAKHHGWKICCITGVPSRETLYVNDHIFVSARYEKWVKCVWLLEHMSMIERSRRHERYSVKRIDASDVDVYRLAFKCVFDSFIDVYETIRSDRYSRVFRLVKKKNAIEATCKQPVCK